MIGGVNPGFFGGGAIGISVAAHAVRESFVSVNREISTTQGEASKGAHLRVTGDLVKDGFERVARQFRQTQTEAQKTGGVVKGAFDSMSKSSTQMATVVDDRLLLVDKALGRTRGEFLSVAEAANYSAAQIEKAALKEEAAVKAQADAQRRSGAGGFGGGGAGGGKAAVTHADNFGKQAGDSWKKGFEKTANLGKWITLGAAGLGIVSVKIAADFQRQMEMIHTQAGYSQKSVKELTGQVEKLSPAVGIGPTKLAEGLFHLASAGIPAAKAMEVLTKAAMLAKVGASDMDETTYALVSLLKTAPKDIHNASEAVGVMNDIVGKGDLRMKDLVKALGSGLVPAGKAVGLGLRDVGAALDVLTARGIPAEQGATRLRTTLSLVANPTAKAKKALEELGISHHELAKEFRTRGIAGALEDLQSRLDKVFPKGRSLSIEEQKTAVSNYSKSLEEAGVEGKKQAVAIEAFERKLKETGSAAIQQSALISEAFGGARIGTTWQILMQNIDEVRKRQDGLNKAGAAKRFATSWEETEKLFSVRASKIGAYLQEIGVKAGNFLIPKIEKAVQELDKFGKWLGKHKAVLDGMVLLFGTTLALAVTAFFAKITLSMGRALREFGMFLGIVNKSPSDVTRAGTAVVAAVEAQTKAYQGLAAAAAEADIAMGGGGGGIPMGRLAGTGEHVTSGGVVLPRGQLKPQSLAGVGAAGAGITEAEALAAGGGAGFFSKLKGAPGKFFGKLSLPKGAGGIGSRLGSGLMAGLGIQIVSGIAGEMIGGKTGKDVSAIGSSAAIGAGLGSFLGPEGTLAGGVLGGLVGGFKQFLGKSESWGEKVGKSAAKGMRKEVGDTLTKTLDNANKEAEKTEEDARKKAEQRHPGTKHFEGYGRGGGGNVTTHTPQEEAEIRQEEKAAAKVAREQKEQGERKAGSAFGRKIVSEQLNVTKEFGGAAKITSILEQGLPRLEKLPEQARAAGGATILALVKGMEEKKELPRKSVHEVEIALGKEFPKLRSMFKRAGGESIKAMADSQKGEAVLKNAHDFIENLRNVYKSFEKIPQLTSENALENFKKANRKLEEEEHKGNENHRIAAKEARKALLDEENKWYGDRIKNVDQRIADLNKHGSKKTKEGNEEVFNLYKLRAEIMGEQTEAGVASVEAAQAKLDKEFVEQMKALGVTASTVKKSASALIGVAGKAGASLNKFLGGKAQGGLANPTGSGAADDHILVAPDGTPVAAMSGTEGVINTPQMGIIDSSLSLSKAMGVLPWGSLNELWGSGLTHYAKGGMLPPTPMARANHLNSLHLPYLWGGHHGDRLITNPSPGLDCSSTVSYVLGIPPKVSGEFEHYGSPGPGNITIYSNPDHVFMRLGQRFFGTSGFGHPKIGGGPGWFEIPPSADYLKGFAVTHVDGSGGATEFSNIKEPKYTGPSGVMEAIGKSMLHKETTAANKQLEKLFNEMGGGPNSGQSLVDSVKPVPGIMKIAEQAAKAAGVPFDPNIVRVLLSKESGGGRDLPPHDFGGNLDPAGPFQVISETFRSYMTPGHTNRMNPLDNALAAFRYIKSRYHTLGALASATGLLGSGYKGYATGGPLAHSTASHVSRESPRGRGPIGTSKIGRPKRNPNQKLANKLHPKTSTKAATKPRTGKQVMPASVLKASAKLQNFLTSEEIQLPSGQTLDAADKEIAAIDTKYTQEQGYFQLIDNTLTPEEEKSLRDLRAKQFHIITQVNSLEGETGLALHTLVAEEKKGAGITEGEALTVMQLKEKNKKALIQEGRRIATLRHSRAGKVMKLAEELSKKHEKYMNQKEKVVEKIKAIREEFRKRKESWKKRKPQPMTGAKESIKNKAKGELAHAGKLSTREAIKRRERSELNAVTGKERGAHKTWADEGLAIGRSERATLKPHEKQEAGLKRNFRHQSETEKKYRQKYARQGWAQAWKYETDKWKLQDKITAENKREKELTGKVDPSAQEIMETTKGTLGAEHKSIKEAEKAEAALTAIEEKTSPEELEIAKNIATEDVGAGIAIPDDVLAVFDRAGLPRPTGLSKYQQEGKKKEEEGTTGEAPTAAEVARLAVQQLANLDASSQQLYQQFGSNAVSTHQLSAALLGVGTGGVKYFGAGAGGIPEGSAAMGQRNAPASSNIFNQYNTYSVGPEDPHVHAQRSGLEFQTRFG